MLGRPQSSPEQMVEAVEGGAIYAGTKHGVGSYRVKRCYRVWAGTCAIE